MDMAVQALYGNHTRGLADDWAGRDERNFGPCHPARLTRRRAIASPTKCRTSVAQLSFHTQSKSCTCAETSRCLRCSHSNFWS
jgi:hypothetical protein